MTIEEIERMLKDAAEEILKSKPSELKRLGIDEIALIKGKGNYCSVLIDLDLSKLIAVALFCHFPDSRNNKSVRLTEE